MCSFIGFARLKKNLNDLLINNYNLPVTNFHLYKKNYSNNPYYWTVTLTSWGSLVRLAGTFIFLVTILFIYCSFNKNKRQIWVISVTLEWQTWHILLLLITNSIYILPTHINQVRQILIVPSCIKQNLIISEDFISEKQLVVFHWRLF